MIENMTDYPWFTFLVLVGFLLDWLAIACKWKKLKPFTKLLAMVLLIGWTLIVSGWKVDLVVGFLLLAQIFGLFGDAEHRCCQECLGTPFFFSQNAGSFGGLSRFCLVTFSIWGCWC